MRNNTMLRILALVMALCMLPALMGAAPMAAGEEFAPEAESAEAAPEAPVSPEEIEEIPEAPEEPAPETAPDMPETASLDPESADEPMAAATSYDYYVVWSAGDTTLTFQKGRPTTGGENTDWWSMYSSDSFLYYYSPTARDYWWHTKEICPNVTKVEFQDNITMNGYNVFTNFDKLQTVSGRVTLSSARNMFYGCTALETLDTTDWGEYAGLVVTDMFKEAGLKKVDLSGWKTSVTGTGTFQSSKVEEVDLSGWTLQAGAISWFANCTALEVLTVNDSFQSAVEGSDSTFSGCGDGWHKLLDDDFGSKSTSEMDEYFRNAKQPGTYYRNRSQLVYDANGGTFDGGGEKTAALFKIGETVTLTADTLPTKAGFVCVGWSESKIEAPYSKDADPSTVSDAFTETLNMDAGKTVYAVWADDTNGNKIADYQEAVDLTFNINGGDGSADTVYKGTYTMENLLAGATLHLPLYSTLKWTKAWMKDGESASHPAILAGWTDETNKVTDVILEGDTEDDGAKLSGKLIERDELTVPEENTTYYAAYAADENGDNIPDYLEGAVHVEYYANGGSPAGDTRWEKPETGLVYQCSHHHVAGEENVALVSVAWAKHLVEKTGAVLAGWSAAQHADVYTEAPAGGVLITEVTMPSAGNAKVYAVWAADVNANGVPDYNERITLTLDANGGKFDGGGDKITSTHLEGDSVTIEDLSEPERERAVFEGWSKTKNEPITSEEEKNAAGVITGETVTLAGATTLYAVWAADVNDNGVSDYEEAVDLTFVPNGGNKNGAGKLSGSADDAVYEVAKDCLPGAYYHLPEYGDDGWKWTKEWTKADGTGAAYPAVLAGWSTTPVKGVILEDDADSAGAKLHTQLINRAEFKVPDEDTLYYAVYAADENDDELPDYREGSVQVEYYANGGTPLRGYWVNGIEGLFYKCSHHHVADAVEPLLNVAQAKVLYVQKDKAVLVGWSTDAQPDLAAKPAAGLLITEVKMPPTGNAKVYAVWAVDANGNGTPDYDEAKPPVEPGPGDSGGWEPPAADKTEMKKAIDEAGDLDPEDYTEDTWSEVEKALEDAKEVYDDPSATQKEADDAVKALKDAVAGLEPKPEEKEPIQPPASGTGWVYDPETGDWYFFKDGSLVQDYWVGKIDGASMWDGNWYYVDGDGKLLTGFHYLDNLKGGKDWYMLQTTNANGCIGRMLDGWQWLGPDIGMGWFNTGHGGKNGQCTWTEKWGSFDPVTGLWADGLSHR